MKNRIFLYIHAMRNDSGNKICISLASDAKNITAMATVIVSALHNKKADNCYVFYLLLAGDVGDGLQEKLKGCAKGFEESCQINLLNLGSEFSNVDLLGNYLGGYLNYVTYFRSKIPSLLPDLEKIIYIDTDILVRQDLEEMWNFALGENYIAAVPNYYGIVKEQKKYIKAGFLSTDFYINAGVLLMNLKKMREDGIGQKYAAKIGDKKLCKVSAGDQIILNYVCYPKIAFLPCKWNVTTRQMMSYNGYIHRYDIFCSPGEFKEAWDNPAIFHWAGPKKPWKYYDVPLSHEWFRYYLKTPMGGEILQREASIKGKIKNLIRIAIGLWRDGSVY